MSLGWRGIVAAGAYWVGFVAEPLTGIGARNS